MSKRAKHQIKPSTRKEPREAYTESATNKNPSWRIGIIDLDGPWGWRNAKDEVTMLEIFDKLKNFESMTWGEIEQKKGKSGSLNHLMPVEQICRAAKKRLMDISQDDCDTLYSLHLMGTWRIWGIKDNEILRILWWDPDHTVYPVYKK